MEKKVVDSLEGFVEEWRFIGRYSPVFHPCIMKLRTGRAYSAEDLICFRNNGARESDYRINRSEPRLMNC